MFLLFYKLFEKFTQNLIVELACSVTDFLADGIPDYPLNGYITGSTRTVIRNLDGNNYTLGWYSHTIDGVSYYTNGSDAGCGSARQAQITWYCGDRHIELTSASEPKSCEYHFELEINCCQGMKYIVNFFCNSNKIVWIHCI